MADVSLYTKSWCPYCKKAKALLEGKGVKYSDFDVTSDPALEKEMIEKSGQRTVPQIFIGGRHIGGCDDLHALENEGKLDAMLAA